MEYTGMNEEQERVQRESRENGGTGQISWLCEKAVLTSWLRSHYNHSFLLHILFCLEAACGLDDRFRKQCRTGGGTFSD